MGRARGHMPRKRPVAPRCAAHGAATTACLPSPSSPAAPRRGALSSARLARSRTTTLLSTTGRAGSPRTARLRIEADAAARMNALLPEARRDALRRSALLRIAVDAGFSTSAVIQIDSDPRFARSALLQIDVDPGFSKSALIGSRCRRRVFQERAPPGASSSTLGRGRSSNHGRVGPRGRAGFMRIATYNVANLFERARALDLETWADGRAVLEAFARVTALLAKPRYTPAIQRKIEAGLLALGLGASDTGKFVLLRQNRGKLRRRVDGALRVVATGPDDWWGWLELRRDAVNAVATRLTGRVIRDLQADVLGVVEAESRPALDRFVAEFVCGKGESPGPTMLIEGTDDRGIDVGVVLRRGFRIVRTLSHLYDEDAEGRMFRRDCSEHEIEAPDGRRLVVLVNHFKSQGYGSAQRNDGLRLRQARRVAEIYRGLRAAGHAAVAVLGDLNDEPRAAPLAPLLVDTDMRDVSTHARFDDGGFPGTHGACRAADKLDYILLSPALFGAVRRAGVDRRGIWAKGRQAEFGTFAEIKGPAQAASDHAALWAELED